VSNEDEKSIMLTGEDQVTAALWISTRSALGLEIRTGMNHSKGSILSMLRRNGITKANNKKQAWVDLDNAMVAAGLPPGRKPWTDAGSNPPPREPVGDE
jgi:hypothetical protein